MSKPTITKNRIVFSDHAVVCSLRLYNKCGPRGPVYLQEMAESLTQDGSADKHRAELRNMNNDGSWTVRKLKA